MRSLWVRSGLAARIWLSVLHIRDIKPHPQRTDQDYGNRKSPQGYRDHQIVPAAHTAPNPITAHPTSGTNHAGAPRTSPSQGHNRRAACQKFLIPIICCLNKFLSNPGKDLGGRAASYQIYGDRDQDQGVVHVTTPGSILQSCQQCDIPQRVKTRIVPLILDLDHAPVTCPPPNIMSAPQQVLEYRTCSLDVTREGSGMGDTFQCPAPLSVKPPLYWVNPINPSIAVDYRQCIAAGLQCLWGGCNIGVHSEIIGGHWLNTRCKDSNGGNPKDNGRGE